MVELSAHPNSYTIHTPHTWLITMSKTVLVTGGTRGIGGAVSRVLSRAGWSVIAASNSKEEIDAFELPENARVSLLDVTDDESVDNVFNSMTSLNALVNCAGILQRDAEYDLAVFQKVIEVNLIGTMRCCVKAHPLLTQTSGSIVNTASMLSTFGGPLVPAYAASKGGVAQLTKSLAGKWAEDNIRVNAVAPGWIETEMTQGIREAPARSDAILARTPMKRWGKAEEVGNMVKWLLSDEASFVTGSIYPVDGGYKAL